MLRRPIVIAPLPHCPIASFLLPAPSAGVQAKEIVHPDVTDRSARWGLRNGGGRHVSIGPIEEALDVFTQQFAMGFLGRIGRGVRAQGSASWQRPKRLRRDGSHLGHWC